MCMCVHVFLKSFFLSERELRDEQTKGTKTKTAPSYCVNKGQKRREKKIAQRTKKQETKHQTDKSRRREEKPFYIEPFCIHSFIHDLANSALSISPMPSFPTQPARVNTAATAASYNSQRPVALSFWPSGGKWIAPSHPPRRPARGWTRPGVYHKVSWLLHRESLGAGSWWLLLPRQSNSGPLLISGGRLGGCRLFRRRRLFRCGCRVAWRVWRCWWRRKE